MASLDSYIVNISLPEISQYFGVSMNDVSSVVLVFLLLLVGTMLVAGKLADIIGLRLLLFVGYLVFVAGSLGCGLSGSLLMLNVFRGIQGVGAAVMTVAPFTIIPRFLPSSINGWAFGLMSTFAAAGLTIGSPLGGFITGSFSWHWIFLINVPVGIIAAVFTLYVVPTGKPQSKTSGRSSFDISGAMISFLAIAVLTFVLSQGKEMGWASVRTVSLIVAFVLLFVALIRVEKVAQSPVFDFSLLRNRVFVFSTLSTVFVFLFLSGNFFLLPFYLTGYLKLSTQNAGLILMIYSVVYMVAGPLAGKASDRIKPAKLGMIGAMATSVGSMLFAVFLGKQGMIPVLILQMWSGIFMGLYISPVNNLVMASVSSEKKGAASGLFSTLSRLSMIMGVVIFELLFSAGTGNADESMISSLPEIRVVRGFEMAYYAGTAILLAGALSLIAISGLKKSRHHVESSHSKNLHPHGHVI
jgi:EmrB/QacA subfamily drug resistance transporter